MSHYKPYPRYKDSGVEWLGKVPEHWSTVQLRRIARFTYGDSLMTDDREEGPIPVYGSNGPVGSHNTANTKAPTIVIGRKGSFGKLNYCEYPVFTIDTTYFVDQRHTLENLKWLFYALQPLDLDAHTKDSAVPGLSREDAYGNYVPLPPKNEQEKIAAYLDRETTRIDALIEKKQRLVELLKEKRQAVITQAVTKGLDTNVPMKDSGVEWLGEVPAHWEVMRISRLFHERSEKGRTDLPILSVSIHYGVTDSEITQEESDRKLQRMDNKEDYKLVAKGDIVYNMMRAWQGAIGAARVDGLVSPAYIIAKPQRKLIAEYFEAVFRTDACIQEMRRYSRGITDFRLRLYWDEFSKISLPVPPLTEQAAIIHQLANLTKTMEFLIESTERSISLLKERRSALITAAVTGQIDVRDTVRALL